MKINVNSEKKNEPKKEVYSLACPYYKKKFDTLEDLIQDVYISGMDPNYSVTLNGKSIREKLINFMAF
jgi:hypothetical protein